jgi:hypothetical protein
MSVPDDVDRKPDADKRNHDAEAITDAADAPELNTELNPELNLTGDNTKDREPTDREAVNDDNIIYITTRADAGGTGNQPPTLDADAAEQPDEGDGDNDDDNDLDVEPYDELDEAAAQHKEDWRRPTVAWPEPVNGEQVFNDTVDIFDRFMIPPEGTPEVLSLWVFSGYALHACNLPFAVRLMITSAGANSGKTTLLDLLTHLVRHPEPVSDITPASLYRSLNARKCVLLDEADHNLPSRAGSRNELIQMINSGHKRATAVVIRTESVKTPNGTFRINRRYPIFAPVAMAGIGTFAPNTTRSRCYEVRLMRKMPDELVETFIPQEHAPMMRELRMKIHRFVLDNKNAIRDCRPVMDSDLLHNRQRDNSGVLLQIADVIGGECSVRARRAIKTMTRSDVQDVYEVLLEDIASILLDPEVMVNYAGAGQPPNMRHIGYNNCVFSADLCDLIVQYFPHRETYTGFTTARLATMLSRFDIEPEPRVKRRGSDNGTRWYRRDAFSPWFVRYGLGPPEAVKMERARESDASGEPGDTPAKGATPTRDVPGQGVAGSNVAPSTTPSEADETPAASPHMRGEIVYANTHVVEPTKGDKKRGDRLRVAVEAVMLAGEAEPDAVEFICARFWVIQRDGKACFVLLNDAGELEWSPIAPPGLIAKDGTIHINPDKTLTLAESDFMAIRPLVNKYRKMSVE